MAKNADELTGLGTIDALMRDLPKALTDGDPVSVAAIDLDGFHDVNVAFGQEMGDRVLTVVAEIIREQGAGTAFRIGGDEFVIIMAGVTLEQAFLRMEALRARVEASAERFALPGGRGLTITVGVAQYPRDAKDGKTLVRAADAALMAAKEAGRNQVALPPNEEMVMKSCYYPAAAVRRLKSLADRVKRKESSLLREALDDLLRKYDTPS
jgi:diguanylate cyclase